MLIAFETKVVAYFDMSDPSCGHCFSASNQESTYLSA
jgi:hypothetical protein